MCNNIIAGAISVGSVGFIATSNDIPYGRRGRLVPVASCQTTGDVAIARIDNISYLAPRGAKITALTKILSITVCVHLHSGIVPMVRCVGIGISVTAVDNVADHATLVGHAATCVRGTATGVVNSRDGVDCMCGVEIISDHIARSFALAAVDDLVNIGILAGLVSPTAGAISAHLAGEAETGVGGACSRIVAAAVIPTSAIGASIVAGRRGSWIAFGIALALKALATSNEAGVACGSQIRRDVPGSGVPPFSGLGGACGNTSCTGTTIACQ